jgi:hypothetical protein
MKTTTRKKKKLNIDLIVEFALLIAMLPILYQLFIIEEVIREWINKPQTVVLTNIGYYKCGGTKKSPKFCPIIIKEEFVENY